MVRWGQRLQASTHPLSDLLTRDLALLQTGRDYLQITPEISKSSLLMKS